MTGADVLVGALGVTETAAKRLERVIADYIVPHGPRPRRVRVVVDGAAARKQHHRPHQKCAHALHSAGLPQTAKVHARAGGAVAT